VCPRDEAIDTLTKRLGECEEAPGRVYFMATRDRTLVKIGKTRSKDDIRFVRITGQSPVPIDLIAEIDGYTRVEKRIQDQFEAYRQHGEWFRFEGALKLFVEAIIRTGTHPCITEREIDRGKIRDPAPLVDDYSKAGAELDRGVVQEPAEIAAEMARMLPTMDDIEAEKCRRSLSYFVRKAWLRINPGIVLHWGWHLEEICKHVQAMLEEWIKAQQDPSYRMKAQNLIVNCPPRALKSTIVSICAPAWMWLRWPSWKALFVSANPRVAVRDARACRALIEDPWYQQLRNTLSERFEDGTQERESFSWSLDQGHNADTDFANTSGGVRMAMGFSAIVTGLGGDAIFVDDPNDMKKVVSEVERSRINDTWDLSLCNRINDYDRSIRVMIMQRGHEIDLTGHWVSTMSPKGLVHLVMPLEFDPEMVVRSPFGYTDPRTVRDESLHPARFSAETIEELKKKPGFSGQYNQKPVPDDGMLFKRDSWNFFTLTRTDDKDPLKGCRVSVDHNLPARPRGCTTRPAIQLPKLDHLAITIDATFGSLGEDASCVGLLVIGTHKADRFVIEDRTKARTFTDTIQAIRDVVADYPAVTVKIIEKKANGAAVIQTLQSELGSIVSIENNDNYAIRWNAMSPSVQAGNWYILEHAPWASAFVAEFALCPKGAKDDRIDAASTLQKYFATDTRRWMGWK
jgi:predicted phage terminase large subunit-like protein